MKTIVWANEVNKESIPQVGGKGANLGEMLNVDLPIPQAFIVTAEAFDHFITTVGIKDEILKILEERRWKEMKIPDPTLLPRLVRKKQSDARISSE